MAVKEASWANAIRPYLDGVSCAHVRLIVLCP